MVRNAKKTIILDTWWAESLVGPGPIWAGIVGSCAGPHVDSSMVGGSSRVLTGPTTHDINNAIGTPPATPGICREYLRCINSINAVPPKTPPNPSILIILIEIPYRS